MEWSDYDSGVFFDEVMKPNAQPRAVAEELCSYLGSLSKDEILLRKSSSERCIAEMGVSLLIVIGLSILFQDLYLLMSGLPLKKD